MPFETFERRALKTEIFSVEHIGVKTGWPQTLLGFYPLVPEYVFLSGCSVGWARAILVKRDDSDLERL